MAVLFGMPLNSLPVRLFNALIIPVVKDCLLSVSLDCYFSILDGDAPRTTSYGVNISQLIALLGCVIT